MKWIWNLFWPCAEIRSIAILAQCCCWCYCCFCVTCNKCQNVFLIFHAQRVCVSHFILFLTWLRACFHSFIHISLCVDIISSSEVTQLQNFLFASPSLLRFASDHKSNILESFLPSRSCSCFVSEWLFMGICIARYQKNQMSNKSDSYFEIAL